MYFVYLNLFVGTQVADMLLELCVTELEDVATDSQSGRLSSQPVVVESSHPYTDDTSTSGTVKIPGQLVFFCLFSISAAITTLLLELAKASFLFKQIPIHSLSTVTVGVLHKPLIFSSECIKIYYFIVDGN